MCLQKTSLIKVSWLKDTITAEEILQNLNNGFVQIKRQYFLKKQATVPNEADFGALFIYFILDYHQLLAAEAGKETKSGEAWMSPVLCDTVSTGFIALLSCECSPAQ